MSLSKHPFCHGSKLQDTHPPVFPCVSYKALTLINHTWPKPNIPTRLIAQATQAIKTLLQEHVSFSCISLYSKKHAFVGHVFTYLNILLSIMQKPCSTYTFILCIQIHFLYSESVDMLSILKWMSFYGKFKSLFFPLSFSHFVLSSCMLLSSISSSL